MTGHPLFPPVSPAAVSHQHHQPVVVRPPQALCQGTKLKRVTLGEKAARKEVMALAVPPEELALATGGTEKSWYRCIFPFGIVSVVIGVAATCITFTINGPQMDIAKVVSVATLIFGVGLLVAAYVCWRAKRERQRKRQRQEPVALEQGAL
uniref:Transmembrane protein 100 n=1 Tax=Ficedula albicollis TaxID=59894 RepID=A0A803VYQ8_FICAL